MVKRKIPPTRFPDAIAVTYQRRLLKLVREMHRMTIREFDKAIKPQIQSYQADANELSAVQKLFNLIKAKISNIFDDATLLDIVNSFVAGINLFNMKNMNDQAKVVGINPIGYENWIDDYVQSSIIQNVSYIKSIGQQYHNKVETLVYEGMKNGASTKEMREQIVKQFHISESKAQFIAVDQSGTIHGQLVAKRHQNMGVKKFEWVTSGDEKVRKTHQALDGKEFSYEQPPAEGLPGTPYRCRCTAYPIFTDEKEIKNAEKKLETSTSFEARKIMDKTNMKQKANEKNYSQFINHLEKIEDDRTKKLYEKLGSKLSYNTVGGNSAYAKGTNVQLTQSSFDGEGYKNPLRVVYHENGHAFDYLGLQLLTGKNKVPTGKKIKKKVLRKTVEVDEMIEHASGLPKYKLKETIERDLWEYVNGEELPMLSDLGSKPRKKAEKESWEKKRTEIYSESKVNFEKFEKTMVEKYGRKSRQLAAISDIYESTTLTSKSYPFGIGHGKDYYKVAGPAETEFFAHVSETITTDKESYNLIKKIFPKSVKVWEQIVDDILKAGES